MKSLLDTNLEIVRISLSLLHIYKNFNFCIKICNYPTISKQLICQKKQLLKVCFDNIKLGKLKEQLF